MDDDVKGCLNDLLVEVTMTTTGDPGNGSHDNTCCYGSCDSVGYRGDSVGDGGEIFDESIDSVLSFQSLNSSTEVGTPRQQPQQIQQPPLPPQPSSLQQLLQPLSPPQQQIPSDIVSRSPDVPRGTAKSAAIGGKKGKKGKEKTYFVDIQTDDVSSENLLRMQDCGDVSWTLDHDKELVSYLVAERKETPNIESKISPALFDKSKLIRHPLISSIRPPTLAYRSIALFRIVSVIDDVLDVLVGPSLPRDQFDDLMNTSDYPLDSFTERSFEGSDSQLNVEEARVFHGGVAEEQGEQYVYQEARNPNDKELLHEVFAIISNETNNVKQQQQILLRKLDLLDNINDQVW